MDFSKFNDLDLEEKIVESNFNNDLQLLRKIFLENRGEFCNLVTRQYIYNQHETI